MGSKWVAISKYLQNRTESDVKNKFYTTLKRVATQAQIENPVKFNPKFVKCKKNLIQFVDAAILYNHLLSSKKGRKKNADKAKARREGLLFPKSLSPVRSNEMQYLPASPVRPSFFCYQNVVPMSPPAFYSMPSWHAPPVCIPSVIPNPYQPVDYGVSQIQMRVNEYPMMNMETEVINYH